MGPHSGTQAPRHNGATQLSVRPAMPEHTALDCAQDEPNATEELFPPEERYFLARHDRYVRDDNPPESGPSPDETLSEEETTRLVGNGAQFADDFYDLITTVESEG